MFTVAGLRPQHANTGELQHDYRGEKGDDRDRFEDVREGRADRAVEDVLDRQGTAHDGGQVLDGQHQHPHHDDTDDVGRHVGQYGGQRCFQRGVLGLF